MSTKRPRAIANVLVQLGFDDAEELSTKVELAVRINDLIAARKLNQVEAAALVGLTQPKISQIRNYRLQDISLEKLLVTLTALGQRVVISVSPARRKSQARIAVAA